MHTETFWDDGGVLYLDCGTGCMTVYGSQSSQNSELKWVNYIHYM